MNHLNSVLLEGVTLENPQYVRISDCKTELVKFDIASDRHYINRDGLKSIETVIMPIQCWGDLGAKVFERLSKGTTVRIIGRLRLSKWLKSDGKTEQSIEIVAQHIEFRKSGANRNTEIIED